MSDYKVYKIIDHDNDFFKYVISDIDNGEMVLEHFEHYCGLFPLENAINKYFNLVADWDTVDFEESKLNPIDVVNKSIPQDEKCMNVSNKFEELVKIAEDEFKKEREAKAAKKTKVPKEKKEAKPKAAPKPKAKKAEKKGVVIEMNPPPLNIN